MEYRTASPDRYGLLKAYARENRRNATLAEQVLWNYLRERPLDVIYKRQHIIGDYIADFVALSEQLIIEVDGAYHAEREQQGDDAIRTANLEHLGFRVIRFTNEEVLYNTNQVINVINEQIRTHPSSLPLFEREGAGG